MQSGKKLRCIVAITIAIIIGGAGVASYLGLESKSKASSTVSVNESSYGQADNNDHSDETKYNISDRSPDDSNVKYTADKMCNGTILHAWCWSFNTIKENMAEIKKAGYTSIQTSPITECRIGENNNDPDMSIRNWYYHYQPTGYDIGNYQLGTEAEFKEMCSVAEQYGMKIIVDAVLNHMTSKWDIISPEYQNNDYYHTNVSVENWENRWNVTQQALQGLWDVNTQNSEVQQFALSYVNRCVADGADGFRYDAARHIELPDDSGYGGDFWPVVSNNGAEFQYGEILQDALSRDNAYTKYIAVTASVYGADLRNYIANNNLNVNNIMGYSIDAKDDDIVTWVESHDTFANDDRQSTWLTNEQIKLAWACITARKATSPLFFSRPVGAGGTDYDNRFPGYSQIGDAGDEFYKDDEITAVNIFRNEMEAEGEYLRNIDGNSVLMVERGKKGVVIINSEYSAKSINSTTNLANGDYYNHTDDGSLFKVSNGKITGTVPARSIAVLYQGSSISNPNVGITGYKTGKEISFTGDFIDLELLTSNSTAATYSIDDGSSYKYSNGKAIRIGWGCNYGTKITITLKAENDSSSKMETFTFVKVDPSTLLSVSFTKPSDWSSAIYAYIYKANGSQVNQYASWPGTAMTCTDSNEYQISFDDTGYEGGYIIFTDGNNQVPASQEDGFTLVNGASYDSSGMKPVETIAPTLKATTSPTISPTIKATETPTVNPTVTPTITPTKSADSNEITIYYYTTWNAKAHYQIGNGNWTDVPGVSMQTSDIEGYKVITIDLGKATTLKACFNDGNGNWDNNNGNNYYFDSTGTYTVKDGNVMSGKAK